MTEPARQVFSCRQCGECCRGEGGILLTEVEVQRLARFCGLPLDEFRRRYVCQSPSGPALRVGSEGLCIFNDGGRCRIHPVKPRICRDWPFLPAILLDADELEGAKNACPGISPDCSHEEFLRWWRDKVV